MEHIFKDDFATYIAFLICIMYRVVSNRESLRKQLNETISYQDYVKDL